MNFGEFEYNIENDFNGEVKLLGLGLAGNMEPGILKITTIRDTDTIHIKEFSLIPITDIENLSYVRFSTVSKIFPQPATSTEEITVEYIHDYDTEIEYFLVDQLGKEVFRRKLDFNEAGISILKINFENLISTGHYHLFVRDRFMTIQRGLVLLN